MALESGALSLPMICENRLIPDLNHQLVGEHGYLGGFIETLANILDTGCAVAGDHVAVDSWEGRLTFKDVDQYSNALAITLAERFNIRRGDRVAILAEKSIAIVVVAVAVWKAGAIYMPIDVNNSPIRTRTILEATQPGLIISSERTLKRYEAVHSDIPSLAYEEILRLEPMTLSRSTLPVVQASDIAAIIHTSGSTGVPKGVMLSHGSMAAYFINHNVYLRYDVAACGMNNGPFHFDVSIQDTFLPLSFGSRVVFHQGSFIGPLLMKTIREKRVTHLVVMSSVLDIISQEPACIEDLRGGALKLLVTGGELCDPKLINRWKLALPELRILYGYGPTECNSLCTTHEIVEADIGRTKPYPIGRPFNGVGALLLDDQWREIQTPNVSGVLALAGPQLMAGYWGRPDLTSQVTRVINDRTYYVTGDYCFRDDNGDYHFVGRTDTEVKIRGHRINLNEVRYALLSEPNIRYAQVGAADVGASKHIYAFVYAGPDIQLFHQDILKSLSQKLPPYMLPTYIKIAKDLEMTTTDKVNERGIDTEMHRVIAETPDAYFI
jgi:D-alanine--poly(phosphoribitol) ligase subunit 1